jgi:hypothetical protein
MQQKDIDTLSARKKPEGFYLLDIEKAELRPGLIRGTFFLTVAGTKPWSTIIVKFSPLIYIQQPEYWGIQVVGIQLGIGLPVVTPYMHTEEVTQYLGKKGVEVIGANRTITLKLPE